MAAAVGADASVRALEERYLLDAARLHVIEEVMKKSWLKPDEIFGLLLSYTALGIPVQPTTRIYPTSGFWALYDKTANKWYRRDGIEYKLRKGSTYILENHAKLKVERVTVVKCSYSYCNTNEYFQRRVFSLCTRPSDIVLVHYLDVSCMPVLRTVPTVPGLAMLPPPPPVPSRLPSVSDDSILPPQAPGSAPSASAAQSPFCEDDTFMGFFGAGDGLESLDDILESSSGLSLPDGSTGVPTAAVVPFSPDLPLMSPVLHTDRASGAGFSVLPTVVAMPPPRVPVALPYSILDFAPSRCASEGGVNMLLCVTATLAPTLTPQFTPNDGSTYVCFGSTRAAAEFIAPNVVRCTVPPQLFSDSQMVPLWLERGDQPLTAASTFQYTASTPAMLSVPAPTTAVTLASAPTSPLAVNHNASTGTGFVASSGAAAGAGGSASLARAASSAFDGDGGDDCDGDSDEEDEVGSPSARRSKIRIVERLENSLGVLDDLALANLSDEALEAQTEVILERMITQLVQVALEEPHVLTEVMSLDALGYNVLHYMSMYNYVGAIQLLLLKGVDPGTPTRDGDTPLHLACAHGQVEAVDVLLRHGAKLTRDTAGKYPHDRAFVHGYMELGRALADVVAGKLDAKDFSQVVRVSDRGSALDHDVSIRSELSSIAGAAASSLNLMEASTSSICSGGSFSSIDTDTLDDRTLLREAFSSMTLQDKCAISMVMEAGFGSGLASLPDGSTLRGERLGAAVGQVLEDGGDADSSFRQAMSLMSHEERMDIEQEAKIIRRNVRTWLLQKNYRTVRQSMTRFQALLRGVLARKSFEQAKAAATTLQAVTRGMLARKELVRYRRQASAALLIQRNIRSWYNNRVGGGEHAGGAGGPHMPPHGIPSAGVSDAHAEATHPASTLQEFLRSPAVSATHGPAPPVL